MDVFADYVWAVFLLLVGALSWFLKLWANEHKAELIELKRLAISREEVITKSAATDSALRSIREDLRVLTTELANNNLKLVTAVHELHLQLKDSQALNNREIYQHIDKKLAELRHDIEGMRTRARDD